MSRKRIGALLVLAPTLMTARALVWKSRKLETRSPHSLHLSAAVEILKLKPETSSEEWNRFLSKIDEQAGTLEGDGNSHGNLLVPAERISDEDSYRDPNSPEGKISDDSLNFSAGPFYRWWIRVLESYSQINTSVIETPQKIQRRHSERRPASTPYHYLGNMVHLVQDNSSPAHAANVRHMLFDGVEFWHYKKVWNGFGFGQRGDDTPATDSATLTAMLNEITTSNGWDQNDSFYAYWKKDASSSPDYDRGALANYQFSSAAIGFNTKSFRPQIDRFLRKVIQSARKDNMPDPDPETSNIGPGNLSKYWAMFGRVTEEGFPWDGGNGWTPGARFPTESLAIKVFNYHGTGLLSSDFDRTGLRTKPLAGDKTSSDMATRFLGLIHAQDSTSPQYFPSPGEGDRMFTITTPMWGDAEAGGKWKELNENHSRWLPHPRYIGQPYSLNWGSYGGHWGFPGQKPMDWGIFLDWSQDDFIEKAISAQTGVITPGDLYLVHDKGIPYNPFERASYDSGLGGLALSFPIPPFSWFGYGFLDERVSHHIAPTDETIGLKQVRNSAKWTAVLLDSVSLALPPLITKFWVDTRYNPSIQDSADALSQSGARKRPYVTISPRTGASIELNMDFNRKDTYCVQFYAIPRQVLSDTAGTGGKAPRSGAWLRRLTLARYAAAGTYMPSRTSELWSSDFEAFDYKDPLIGAPTIPDSATDGSGAYYRDYDFFYSGIPLFPLRVLNSDLSLKDFNLTTSAVTSPLDKAYEVIPSPQDATDAWLAFSATTKCTWNGEVGDATGLNDAAASSDDEKLLNDDQRNFQNGMHTIMVPVGPDGTKERVLRNGDYFVLAVAYRKGWRPAFARNQYKFTNYYKTVLEKQPWWNQDWTSINVDEPSSGTNTPPILIPDELFPVHIDTDQVEASTSR